MIRASDIFGAPVCVVLRNDTISRHNLDFDTDIVIGPDWDFFFRFAEIATFGNISQPTCLYRVHQTNISIQTGSQKRLASLAKCREKAIKLRRFPECSLQTRVYIFYDLLVNLLTGNGERQSVVIQWQEFLDLPTHERARLLRLMASEALRRGEKNQYIGDWLSESNKLNPSDWRNTVLHALYSLSPRLCQALIGIRASPNSQESSVSPFGDLFRSGPGSA